MGLLDRRFAVGPARAPMSLVREFPRLFQTVLDTEEPRRLAEFYRELLGLRYREGHEPPADGSPDKRDWLVLVDDDGSRRLAFQGVERLPRSTWPGIGVPQQLHLDLTVSDIASLERQRSRAEALGAALLLDRTDDPEEPLFVLADPSGHPFCIFVA
jgi:catechol 2,3-dioxygenase-like lactoylglutathione lyase family enzyme